MKEKLVILMEHWATSCSDGCCYEEGNTTIINGVELENKSDSISNILQDILEHLGFEVEINEIWTGVNGELL